MSAFGLSRQLNIPRKEAQRYMDLYFERYRRVNNGIYGAHPRAQARTRLCGNAGGRRLYLRILNPATRRAARGGTRGDQ